VSEVIGMNDSSGCGCATFIKVGVSYRILGKGVGLEYLVTEVLCDNCSLNVVNFIILEELMNRKGLMCLNDGSPTCIGVRVQSVLDLTLVFQSTAGQIIWEVYSESTTGSDHYL